MTPDPGAHPLDLLPVPTEPATDSSAAPRTSRPRLLLERARFLAEASRLLAQSLDYETTLATVARLATPELGAWVLVDLVEDDGRIRRLAVVHPDPAKQALARELERGYPPAVEDALGAPVVLRTREPELVPEVTDALLTAAARDAPPRTPPGARDGLVHGRANARARGRGRVHDVP